MVTCLAAVVVGSVVRSSASYGTAVAGTLVIGLGITVGNIVVPVLIRRESPSRRVGVVTGIYVSAMNVGSMVVSVATPPMADVLGWRLALAAWGLLAAVGLLALAAVPAAPAPPGPSTRDRGAVAADGAGDRVPVAGAAGLAAGAGVRRAVDVVLLAHRLAADAAGRRDRARPERRRGRRLGVPGQRDHRRAGGAAAGAALAELGRDRPGRPALDGVPAPAAAGAAGLPARQRARRHRPGRRLRGAVHGGGARLPQRPGERPAVRVRAGRRVRRRGPRPHRARRGARRDGRVDRTGADHPRHHGDVLGAGGGLGGRAGPAAPGP